MYDQIYNVLQKWDLQPGFEVTTSPTHPVIWLHFEFLATSSHLQQQSVVTWLWFRTFLLAISIFLVTGKTHCIAFNNRRVCFTAAIKKLIKSGQVAGWATLQLSQLKTIIVGSITLITRGLPILLTDFILFSIKIIPNQDWI